MAIAPGRARRPGAGKRTLEPPSPEELERCPFCEGREQQTPPEVFSYGPSERQPDTPGWFLRVVPNLYPALERQEVVIHTPRHARSLVELNAAELSNVAGAWTSRAEAAHAEGFQYLQVLVNEGADAGSSLPHTHSQLAWFREEPSVPASERTRAGDCAVCELLGDVATTRQLGLAEAENRILALCHPAGRAPYEVLVAPYAHQSEPWGTPLEIGLDLAVSSLRRIHDVEGPVPINLWLHCAPFGGDGHWHLELVPRLTIFAGLELGAGIYVNSLPPEQAAAALRD